MAFCDPLTPSDDVAGCWHCTAYSHEPNAHYIGMLMVPADYGCAVGCKPCKQEALPGDWMRPGGPRWLKAYMPIDLANDQVMWPNRMANGMVGDLRSIGELDESFSHATTFRNTRRVPEQIYYNRGVCWDNMRNKEGFGKGEVGTDACHCDEHSSTVVGDDGTCGGTPQGRPIDDVFLDLFFYKNIQAVSNSGIFCRQRAEHDSFSVLASTSEFYEPSIFRTNQCGGNLFHFCTADKFCGEPCHEFGDPPPVGCEDEHLNPGYQAFNQVPIEFNDVRLRNGEDNFSFPFGDGPLKDFKNSVLAHLPEIPSAGEGTFVFGQLDHVGGRWHRAYSPRVDLSVPKIPFEFGDCRLRSATYPDRDLERPRHHVPVNIQPYVAEADIEMRMIAQQVLASPEGTSWPAFEEYELAKRIYPQVRMRIRARISYVAFYADSEDPNVNDDSWPQIFESWWPEGHPNHNRGTNVYLLNNIDVEGPSDSFPVVGKPLRYPALVASEVNMSGIPYEDALIASPDQILIFDSQGRQFEIPDIVEWWGYLGVYSGHENVYKFVQDDQGDAEFNAMSECCKLLGYLDGLQVKGWPYNFGAYDEYVEGGHDIHDMQEEGWTGRGLYGGNVQLNFSRHSNYQSICGIQRP